MATITSKLEQNRFVIDLIVTNINNLGKPNTGVLCKAVIDTGATSSLISSKLADRLKLEPMGTSKIMSVTDDKMLIRFEAGFHFPTNLEAKSVLTNYG